MGSTAVLSLTKSLLDLVIFPGLTLLEEIYPTFWGSWHNMWESTGEWVSHSQPHPASADCMKIFLLAQTVSCCSPPAQPWTPRSEDLTPLRWPSMARKSCSVIQKPCLEGEEVLLQLVDWFGVCLCSFAEQLTDSGPCCSHPGVT